MKSFEKPWLEIVELYAEDIITESPMTSGSDELGNDINEGDMPD